MMRRTLRSQKLEGRQTNLVRPALVIALALGLVAALMVLAGASHRDLTDGNDTPGRLDVRKVKTFGEVKKPGWRVLTFGRWRAKEMQDRGFVLVSLDTFGDARFDYYALVSSDGSTMKGNLWRDHKGKPDRRVSKLEVWRADRSSVSLRVPLRKVKRGAQRLEFRWFVKTLYTSRDCRRVCFDRVPNQGAVTDPNGRGLPEPTVTPTGSP